jgi:hypothetical protein
MIALLALLILGCNSSSTREAKSEVVVEKPNDNTPISTHELLTPGSYQALILDSIVASPRLDSINKKLDSAIKSDPKFFANLQRFTKKGRAMPYHEKMGITREGYIELQVLATRVRLAGSKRQPISIQSKDGFYYFKGQDRLSYLNGIAFDSVTNIFYVDTARLFTLRPSIVNDSINYFGSAWAGHTYKNRNYILLEKETVIPDKGRFNAYKITVGKMHPSGTVFFLVSAKEFENGKQVLNLEQTLYLQSTQ